MDDSKIGMLLSKSIRTNLNLNAALSCKGVVGFAALGCVGVAGYQLCKKLVNGRVVAVCGVGSLLFVVIFIALSKDEQSKEREKYDHEERMAKIKHNGRANYESQKDGEDEEVEPEDKPFEAYKPSEAFKPENDLHPMLGNLLPEGFDALVYAPKGSMKSYFVLCSMVQIGLGEEPKALPQELNCAPPDNVFCIYADGENGKAVIKKRLSYFDTRLDGVLTIVDTKQFGNTLEQFFEFIKDMCLKKKSGTRILLGVDNMKSLFNDVNAFEVKSYLNGLKSLREELSKSRISLTTMTLHHTNKGKKQASGSGNITDLLPYVFRLDKKGDFVHLTVEENRNGPKDAVYKLKIQDKPYTHLVYEATVYSPEEESLTGKEKRKVQYEKVKSMLDLGKHWTDITTATGVSPQCYNNWKKEFETA